MESKSQQDHFNNPVVIILVLALVGLGVYFLLNKNSNVPQNSISNSQQAEIDALKKTVEDLKKTQTQDSNAKPTSQETIKTKSFSDIVKEWRNNTALVYCQYGYMGDSSYYEMWGSGLLTNVNGSPQVITNGHVVNKSNLDGCWIKFPDQHGGISTYTANPQSITYDSNGYDVAYINLSSYAQSDIHAKEGLYSISERADRNLNICKQAVNIGNNIVILGYPVYGSGVSINTIYASDVPFEVTATNGIISGKDGIYYTTSAKIEHGNSGGLAIDQTNDCYFGIPTWNESGSFESLGRILPASVFLK